MNNSDKLSACVTSCLQHAPHAAGSPRKSQVMNWAQIAPGGSRQWLLCAGLAAVLPLLAFAAGKRKLIDPAALPPPSAAPVDYSRDIQPILSKNCYSCHGPEKHKGGLRLDQKSDALAGGDSGKVIVPGKSADSLLIHLVSGLDADTVMPPKGEHLGRSDVSTLRAWIDAGALWPESAAGPTTNRVDHWAFKRPQLPPVPLPADKKWIRNPIDAFVLARLDSEKLKPSPEADRVTLIRRLSLDLLGLPPTPGEIAAFVKDDSSNADERLVDRMLASPHFGERWGRHWLDLARYADSDGYEKDSARPYAYLFRDWVIDAINRDLPFDQFTIEQIAGDLLPNASDRQKIATGFHRQTLTNREGGVDKEEFRCKATVDRVNTTATAWLGLTVGCAECHSHKYDPITQREFYQLYAFFNEASEKDIPAPQPAELSEYNKRLSAWQTQLASLERPLEAFLTNVQDRLPAWEASLTLPAARWSTLKPQKVAIATEGDETLLTPAKDNSISPRTKDPVRSRYTIETVPGVDRVTGFRLEALVDPGKSVGRGSKGDFALSEFAVTAVRPNGEAHAIKLVAAEADFAATNGSAQNAIDGDRNTGWSVGPQTARRHVIVFHPAEPIDLPEGTRLVFRIEQFTVGLLSRFRLAMTTSAAGLEPATIPDSVVAILDTPQPRRTAAQRDELARYFAEEIDLEGGKLRSEIVAHQGRKPRPPETTAAILVADERKTHVHVRGDFLRRGDEVHPATLAVLHPLHARAAKPDRLDLARWIVDPANPLTARVTVNHVWKHLFGRGLVASVNDFGARGEKPSHPDLLDWLAIALSSAPGQCLTASGAPDQGRQLGFGWSRKALIKLIVTSSTYRQSSISRPDLLERDPNNLLLARQARLRVDAETVRDVSLAASGLLNRTIGGPSIRPQLPADIAALGYANSVKWQESRGAEKYRRGMYIFFQRTVPYPMLVTFDAPDSNLVCTRRERSNTPLQALTLLNDTVFFECAQELGKRVHREPLAVDDKIRQVFQSCLSRPPAPAEADRLRQLYDTQAKLLDAAPDNADKIAGEKNSGSAEVAQEASLVALARVVMNLDEFITRD